MSKCFCFFHLCRRIHRVHKQCFIWNYIKAAVTKANKNTKRKKENYKSRNFSTKTTRNFNACWMCCLQSHLTALELFVCIAHFAVQSFRIMCATVHRKRCLFLQCSLGFFSSDLDTFRLRLQHYVISWSSACCIHMYICFPALIIRTICFSFHACECGFD